MRALRILRRPRRRRARPADRLLAHRDGAAGSIGLLSPLGPARRRRAERAHGPAPADRRPRARRSLLAGAAQPGAGLLPAAPACSCRWRARTRLRGAFRFAAPAARRAPALHARALHVALLVRCSRRAVRHPLVHALQHALVHRRRRARCGGRCSSPSAAGCPASCGRSAYIFGARMIGDVPGDGLRPVPRTRSTRASTAAATATA